MNRSYLSTIICVIILSGCDGGSRKSSNKEGPSNANIAQEKPDNAASANTEPTITEKDPEDSRNNATSDKGNQSIAGTIGKKPTNIDQSHKNDKTGTSSDKESPSQPDAIEDNSIQVEQIRKNQTLEYLPLSHSKNKTIGFRVVEGNAIAEGDINLGKHEDLKIKGSIDPLEYPTAYNEPHELDLTKQASIAKSQNSSWGGHRKWINGIVPYTINIGDFSPQDISVIKSAFNEIEAVSNIKFVPAQQHFNQVEVYRGQGCSSEVGMTGGRQYLSLGYGCVSKGVVIHELMHTLGYYHEQSRFDRDQYIEIHWQNILYGMDYNFQKLGRETTTQGPYDYGSIMHYDQYAFTANYQPTITAKLPNAQFGQRQGLSQLDIAALQKAYGKTNTVTGNKPTNEAPRVTLKYSAIWMWANGSFYMPTEFHDDKDALNNIEVNHSLQRNDSVLIEPFSMIEDPYNKHLFYIPIQALNPHNPSADPIEEIMTIRFKDSENAETVVKLPIYIYNRAYWPSMDSGNGFRFVNKHNGYCFGTDNLQLTFGDCKNITLGFQLNAKGQLLAKGQPGQCLATETLSAGASIKLNTCNEKDEKQIFQYEDSKISAQKAMHLTIKGTHDKRLTLEPANAKDLSSQWDMQ
jgi:hypothetical protein